MTKVFVDVGLSLDGQIAGPNRRPGNPLGDGGLAIHDWMFATRAFWEVLVGDGLHLFEGFKPGELKLEQESVASSPKATHITYRVNR